MMILNQGDLYFSEGFLKVIKTDNMLVNRLNIPDKEDKLAELFFIYKKADSLFKLLPCLSMESIVHLYEKFKEEILEDD